MMSSVFQKQPRNTLLSMLCGATILAFSAGQAMADPISPDVQSKADKYKHKLVEWAADPAIIAAVKDSNAKGGMPGMSNAKWDDLAEGDAQIKAMLSTPASKKVIKWEEDKAINKLLVRDAKGNLVAGSSKPLLYNVSARPPFINVMKGQPWHANEVKPDPTTSKKSVQISAPILDGGTAIGVIHSAVSAE